MQDDLATDHEGPQSYFLAANDESADTYSEVHVRLSHTLSDDVTVELTALTFDGPVNDRMGLRLWQAKEHREKVRRISTIKAHVTAILRKLGVTNRTQAVLMAGKLAIDDDAIVLPPEED